MLNLLNVLPTNLVARILIIFSGVVTMIFFVMTLCQTLHTFWSFYHPKMDWYQLPKVYHHGHRIKLADLNVKQHHFYLHQVKNGLVKDFWLGVALIALLMVVFPLFHI